MNGRINVMAGLAAIGLAACHGATGDGEAADATSTADAADPAGAEADAYGAAAAASDSGQPATFRFEGGRLHRDDGSSWDQPLELDHVGQARIGDAFHDEDWFEDWRPVAGGPATASQCVQYTSKALPPGLSMLVVDGAIARFDLASSGARLPVDYAAPFGLRLGQPQAAALAALPPGVEAAAHEFQAPGRGYLNWFDAASGLGLQVETADGAVAAVRWGDAGAATRPEGCP